MVGASRAWAGGWCKTWCGSNGGWCTTTAQGVNSGIKRGLVQTVVGVKHGFRATSDAQQQHVQNRAVAVQEPREPRSEPPLIRAFVDSSFC